MSKKLELVFENIEGRLVTITVDDPIEPVDGEAVKTAMTAIIEGAALTSNGGDIVSIRGARLVERTVETVELP